MCIQHLELLLAAALDGHKGVFRWIVTVSEKRPDGGHYLKKGS